MKSVPSGNRVKPCFECEDGTLVPVSEDYVTTLPEHGEVTITKVPMERCDRCGDIVIGEEGNTYIDAQIDKITGAISPEEVQLFLDKYGLTQKDASEITGYGEKNISRWLRGRARPSASVSNFLRLLLSNEDAFHQLAEKRFGSGGCGKFPAEDRQPDEEEKKILKLVDYAGLASLGVVGATQSPRVKRSNVCQFFRASDLIEVAAFAEKLVLQAAAFKDTSQRANCVSGAFWLELGQRAAEKVQVAPYDRDKLEKAVRDLRELTRYDLLKVVPKVQKLLAGAGVALVLIPQLNQSAFRGCTRLLDPSKAMIIHGLKYRTLAQFWIVLFHEIAHLLLHIESEVQVFTEYEDRGEDPCEAQADDWAHDALVDSGKLIKFCARNPSPSLEDLRQFADELNVHPAVAAEVLNTKAGKKAINYGWLIKNGLYPGISEEEAAGLWEVTRTV